jgi:hypothetical protein
VLPGIVDTELAAGAPSLPGLRTIQPDVVADAIVATLRRPRFAVYVPRDVAILRFAHSVAPRGAFERLLRVTRAANLMTDVDRAERVGYDRRALVDGGTRLPRE